MKDNQPLISPSAEADRNRENDIRELVENKNEIRKRKAVIVTLASSAIPKSGVQVSSKPIIKPQPKVAYLTFDDGPSPDITPKILDILKKYNLKATFFVIGQYAAANPQMLIRELNQGNVIGNHTYSHDPDFLYSDPKNLVGDFQKSEQTLKSILPKYKCKLVRFPGGSTQRPKIFKDAVKAAGYRYVDWNCLSKDAENPNYTPNDLFSNIIKTSKNKNNLIVLMHDSSGRQNTVQVLPRVIEYLKAQGYTFKLLS